MDIILLCCLVIAGRARGGTFGTGTRLIPFGTVQITETAGAFTTPAAVMMLQHISANSTYEFMSAEELRWEDYKVCTGQQRLSPEFGPGSRHQTSTLNLAITSSPTLAPAVALSRTM